MRKVAAAMEATLSERVTRTLERGRFALIAKQHGSANYRERLLDLYRLWLDYNDRYFDSELQLPHLGIGSTKGCLGEHTQSKKQGGELVLTLNAGLVFGVNRKLVGRPWRAVGLKRFVDDLLLRLMVRQFVLAVEKTEEKEYQGFGPLFAEHANRISAEMDLPVVAARGKNESGQPAASGWPHGVRSERYYRDAVTDLSMRLMGAGRPRRRKEPATQGAFELLGYLLNAGRIKEVRALVAARLKTGQEVGAERSPKRKQSKARLTNEDSGPMSGVEIRQEWLTWNSGTVRRLARSIREGSSFADLPLLVEALRKAGCRESRILNHLHEVRTHHKECWVLRQLSGEP